MATIKEGTKSGNALKWAGAAVLAVMAFLMIESRIRRDY